MSAAAVSKYVNDMWPGSPQEKASPSASGSGRSSRLSSRSRSRSSSRSSGPASRSSSRSSSRSRSRPRRSRRSRSRRRHQRKYRRYSRSYSRSRSRSRGRRAYRDGYYGRPRRHYQSPLPYRSRSRSRSRGRSHHRRSYYAITRGRRYYGFGRTVYPEDRPRWRERSRTRSRSRSGTPFRLSEKDRMELLEIAKANAAKALGTANFDLPASLRSVVKETAVSSGGAKMEHSEKQTEDGSKNPSEKSSTQRNIVFSSNNSVAKPVQKTAKAAAEETSSGSPKIDKKKSPYGLWIPV
ncbi:arginine/serine-rich protein 1 isoform X1 [Psammomys obesus]|uniref:arginine/serine-rich protein 1 isoform X1 n=1 Tax=Psammomys obesus TaxID=48139 RepID=UPI002452D239|nr:arginine/serine-rich protein 1 isoform X1 [Psammomys obesus]